MSVTAIAYTKFAVSDSDAMREFYCTALGFNHGTRIEEGEGDNAFVENFIGVGPQQVVLIAYKNRPAPAPGESYLALMVEDVDASLAAIEKAGGTITMPGLDIPEHKLRMGYATDPEGHVIELMHLDS
ncbi:MAG: VOC family protein [Novosphingobium sp.]|nr:VOC family protein [Novosphingobium sp.]